MAVQSPRVLSTAAAATRGGSKRGGGWREGGSHHARDKGIALPLQPGREVAEANRLAGVKAVVPPSGFRSFGDHRRILHCRPLGMRRRRGLTTVKCTSTAMPQEHERQNSADVMTPDDCGILDADPAGGIVALGKFDALHVGHRSLAIRAASLGDPWIISFSGIAEILGWEVRMPVVAACDRHRVMNLWGQVCDGKVPRQVSLKFSEVRSLSPEAFVRLLAEDLLVKGVVVGQNYRFGYRAAGTVQDMGRLGKKFGLEISVVDLVTCSSCASVEQSILENGANGKSVAVVDDLKVSSTRVRQALAEGDVDFAATLLGRRHRVMVTLGYGGVARMGFTGLRVPKALVLNQVPQDGTYTCDLCFYLKKTANNATEGGSNGRPRFDEKKIGPVKVSVHGGNMLVVSENGAFQGMAFSQADYLGFDF